MRTSFTAAAESYLRAKSLSRGTRNEYHSTLRKWDLWGRGAPIEKLQRKHVREFLNWVYERAVANQGTNPGRTALTTTLTFLNRRWRSTAIRSGGSRTDTTPIGPRSRSRRS
jgi:hypothetical protein